VALLAGCGLAAGDGQLRRRRGQRDGQRNAHRAGAVLDVHPGGDLEGGMGLLVRQDPGKVIYYGDGGAEEVAYTISGGVASLASATRFYGQSPDGTMVVRSLPAGGTATVSLESEDPQSTGTASVVATTAQTVSRRDFDPFGVRVASAGTWPDDKGFVEQVADGSTGWDLLGARQYNPATGSFLSLDPVLEAGSPVQMGGYTYAGNNPATMSDPSGLQLPGGDLSCDNPVTDDPSCGNHTGPASESGHHNGGESGHGGGGGPGSQNSGGCPMFPNLPATWCTHTNPIYTPQFLSWFLGPQDKPVSGTGPCGTLVAELFMTVSECGPSINLAATGNDDETGDSGSSGASGGGIPPDGASPIWLNLSRTLPVRRHAMRKRSRTAPSAMPGTVINTMVPTWSRSNMGTFFRRKSVVRHS
jgi:RHS repeat-associated protein